MGRSRIGLAVAFAALPAREREAIERTWLAAVETAHAWVPAFAEFGLAALGSVRRRRADLLVYLGESSRFDRLAGALARDVPVVFVKSTVEGLLDRPPGAAPRYRMSTGVRGLASALVAAAPAGPSVDWRSLPWPTELAPLLRLDPAERRYVEASVGAFRQAAAARGLEWRRGVPRRGPFSLFLTMHDPAAAALASAACALWPRCTVLAADGMTSTCAPGGHSWPPQVVRVRHWTPRSRSRSNRVLRRVWGDGAPADFDSVGMLFGALRFLDGALGGGAPPDRLEEAAVQPGPLGPMRLTATGRPHPERLVLMRGRAAQVVSVRGA